MTMCDWSLAILEMETMLTTQYKLYCSQQTHVTRNKGINNINLQENQTTYRNWKCKLLSCKKENNENTQKWETIGC